MGSCSWTAVVNAGNSAVIAGWSEYYFHTGKKLPKHSIFFLLIHLTSLEVVNKKNLLELNQISKRPLLV